MRATITQVENGMWSLNTYKDSSLFPTFRVNGAWSTEIKQKGKLIVWHIADHRKVTFIGGKLTDVIGERIDNHRDTDLLNHAIVGENIIFTKDGVFAIIAEGEEMNNLGDKLRAAGVTQNSVEAAQTEPHVVVKNESVTKVVNVAKSSIQNKRDNQMQSLMDFYFERYGTPSSDVEAIKMLSTVYRDLIGIPNQEINEGIAEYYRLITARGLPAFYWLVEAFHVISKKDNNKHTFPYIVGMLRSWLKFGFGHIPSSEETDVINYMTASIGSELTHDALQVIQTLMGTYGAVKCVIAINELKSADYTYFMALSLKDILDNKFGVKQDVT